MLLAAIPLATWGAWLIWARPQGWSRTTAGLGVAALLRAGGLLLLKVWAKHLAYTFAAGLALSWVYAGWQVAVRGWPYRDALGTMISLVPGVCLLLICAGVSYVIHRQYRRRAIGKRDEPTLHDFQEFAGAGRATRHRWCRRRSG